MNDLSDDELTSELSEARDQLLDMLRDRGDQRTDPPRIVSGDNGHPDGPMYEASEIARRFADLADEATVRHNRRQTEKREMTDKIHQAIGTAHELEQQLDISGPR